MPIDLTLYASNRQIRLRFYKHISFCDHAKSCDKCCWLWQGYIDKQGRAYFTIYDKARPHKKLVFPAARLIYTIKYGHTDLFVLHTCDNPACLNYNHLYAGTQADNGRDMQTRGRAPRGENSGLTTLANEDIKQIFLLREQGYTQKAIAEFYGVKQQSISKILLGIRWKHITRESL